MDFRNSDSKNARGLPSGVRALSCPLKMVLRKNTPAETR